MKQEESYRIPKGDHRPLLFFCSWFSWWEDEEEREFTRDYTGNKDDEVGDLLN